MRLNKSLATILILFCSTGYSTAQPPQQSLPSSLFVDSVNKFSIVTPNFRIGNFKEDSDRGALVCVIYNSGDRRAPAFTAAGVTNLEPGETLSQFRTLRRERIDKIYKDITLDTALLVNGHHAFIWEYRNDHNRGEFENLELDVLSEGRSYQMLSICRKVDYPRWALPLRRGLMSFRLFDSPKQMDEFSIGQKSLPESFFIDSAYKFSFVTPNFMVDTGNETNVRANIYSESGTLSTSNIMIALSHTKLNLSEYRKKERDRIDSQGKVTLDTSLKVNGREALLWEWETTTHKGVEVGLRLDLLPDDRVYSLTALCPKTDYSRKASAIRQALMSFKLF